MSTMPSPYEVQPKKVTGGNAPVSTTPVTTTPGSGGGLMSGAPDFKADFAAGDKTAVTREVGANELSSNQLADITSGNSKYIQSARQNSAAQSADRGMLMSSVAVGAGEKAAIDAAQPFAMQQADVYNRTASENMNAQNADAQADQGQWRQAAGQQQQLEAQSVEAGRTRDFTTNENNTQRAFTAGESAAERASREAQAQKDRDFNQGMATQEQDWRREGDLLQIDANKATNAAAALETRQAQYFGLIANREAQLTSTLNAIYSNTNLKPAEQQAAANNAIALSKSIANSYNAVFSQGIPDIFADPYDMQGNPTTPRVPVTTPPATTPTGDATLAPPTVQPPTVQPPTNPAVVRQPPATTAPDTGQQIVQQEERREIMGGTSQAVRNRETGRNSTALR